MKPRRPPPRQPPRKRDGIASANTDTLEHPALEPDRLTTQYIHRRYELEVCVVFCSHVSILTRHCWKWQEGLLSSGALEAIASK